MNRNIIKWFLGLLTFIFAVGFQITDVSALTISGSIDKRVYQKVIRQHSNELKHCYEVALLKDKTLQGRLVTRFVVLPDGSVETVMVSETTLQNSEMEQCVIDYIKDWVFPAMKNGSAMAVEYPFVFSSNYVPPKNLDPIKIVFADENDIFIEEWDGVSMMPEATEEAESSK